MTEAVLLDVEHLTMRFGGLLALNDLSLKVRAGRITSIIGPNGAGKTTFLASISGLLSPSRGAVVFNGTDVTRFNARRMANIGLINVLDGHRVFTRLSVEENLLVAAYDVPKREVAGRLRAAYDLFPELREKAADKAGSLSGGQRQMLCIAQGYVKLPQLLMLDDPSAGLSPILFDRVLSVVASLRAGGTTVILVDQLVEKVISASDRVYAFSQGRVVLHEHANVPGLSEKIEQLYFN